MGKHLISE